MYRIAVVTAIGLAVLTAPAFAATQGPPSVILREPRPPPVAPAQRPQIEAPPPPVFYLFGIPVVVDTPVAAPYCNCAYQLSGGQPATGADAATGLLSSSSKLR